jgi:hypothetical protein
VAKDMDKKLSWEAKQRCKLVRWPGFFIPHVCMTFELVVITPCTVNVYTFVGWLPKRLHGSWRTRFTKGGIVYA